MTYVPNKVWRGGVHRTTPETTQVKLAGAATLLPGCVVNLAGAAAVAGLPAYVLGEQLHGGIDDVPVATDTQRLYDTHSGDLFTGRAAAAQTIAADAPLVPNASGRLEVGTAATAVCYADGAVTGATVADQRIAIKFK